MKKIFITILLATSLTASSQNQIFIGEQSLEATSEWKFSPQKRTFLDDGINIMIGKMSKGGVITISVSSEFGKASIKGKLLIYLKNGKVISTERKIFNDYANDRICVGYFLTTNDIAILKQTNIRTIRMNYIYPYGTLMGLSARNGQEYFYGTGTIINTEIETATEIQNLFY
jgi:hypothetical protein